MFAFFQKDLTNLKFNIKYLPNSRKYLTSENTGRSGVKNRIGLYFFPDFYVP
jgi:hypothetical protein